MKQPLFENAHPLTKIVFLGVIGIIGLIFLGGFSLIIYGESPESLKLLTAIQHIFLFVLPPLTAAFLFSKNVKSYLYLRRIKPVHIVLTILIIFFSIPLINFTAYLNSNMHLPEGLSELERIMKELEDAAKETTVNFLSVDSVGGLLINLTVIALLPAIGEELLFRGVLIRLFNEWFKNIHITILVTAFLFSFIHFQFYGFFPRMLLGIIFGYLMYWSGSILLPMIAHFINNGIAVCIFYFYKDTDVYEKADSFGSGSADLIWVALSTAFLVLLFIVLRNSAKNQSQKIIE